MTPEDKIVDLEDQITEALKMVGHAETRRALAQGKADNYLLELQTVRKARERGRRANRRMRETVTELEAKLYRLTNRGVNSRSSSEI